MKAILFFKFFITSIAKASDTQNERNQKNIIKNIRAECFATYQAKLLSEDENKMYRNMLYL